MKWVSGIALIVLLIACSNVANLFLARALRRQRETAVRVALGVGQRRLMGQWFTESLLLALIGCVAGVLIAQWGGAALRQLFVGPTGAPIPVAGDLRTLGISTGLAILAALLTGVAPAILAGRIAVADALKSGVREGTHHRSALRTGLLVLQITMSVVLLVGAGLFLRSFAHVRALRLGYDVDPVVLVTRNLRGASLPESTLIALHQRILETAQRVPGVRYAAMANFRGETHEVGLYLAMARQAQRQVALLQRALVAAPSGKEPMFHVEHPLAHLLAFPMSRYDSFQAYRSKMNGRILGPTSGATLVTKRFFSLDTQTYQDGALPARTKELLGLVAAVYAAGVLVYLEALFGAGGTVRQVRPEFVDVHKSTVRVDHQINANNTYTGRYLTERQPNRDLLTGDRATLSTGNYELDTDQTASIAYNRVIGTRALNTIRASIETEDIQRGAGEIERLPAARALAAGRHAQEGDIAGDAQDDDDGDGAAPAGERRRRDLVTQVPP